MYLKWINKLLHFCSFQTSLDTGKKKKTEFLQSPSEQTTALLKVPFHDSTDSHGHPVSWRLTRGDAPWPLSSTSHSSPIPRRYFLGSSGPWNKRPPHAERADILACLPGCWEMARAFLQEALVPLSLLVRLRSTSLHRPHPHACVPLLFSDPCLPGL